MNDTLYHLPLPELGAVRQHALPSAYVYLELRDELRQADGTRSFADPNALAPPKVRTRKQ